MTTINEQQVRHIAHLARLALTDDEVTRYRQDLGEVLTYVEQLNEVNTDGIAPTAHAMPVVNAFREDVPTDSLGVDATLQNAPDRADGYFKVPKVLDQRTA